MSPTIGRVSDANDDDRCSSQEAMNKIEEFFKFFFGDIRIATIPR
jgi:hypothetical protein